MESREEILSRDFSTDMEVRNCSDCKHYFYFVGEAGCELDSASYPKLCENFIPDDEAEIYDNWLNEEAEETGMTLVHDDESGTWGGMSETDLQRLERCKKCSKSTEADDFQGGTELYCPLHGYPCDMIIQCDYIPDNKRVEDRDDADDSSERGEHDEY